MSSLDLTPYVDLTLYDKDSQDVIEAALVEMLSKIPEWVPREGNIEMLLLEAMALEVSEAIAAINRLPSATVEILFRLFGIERFLGTQPKTTIAFNLADTLGHEIPAGTRVSLPLSGGLEPVVFTTDVTLDIAAGLDSGSVAATGDRYTADANGILAGTLVDMLDALTFVNTATIGSTVVEGISEETDQTWFDRGINRFGRLSETLCVPDQFVRAAKEHPEVNRAFAIDNYNPAVGPVGSNLGHITVAVYGFNANLSTPQKDALDAEFEAAAQANLSVWIVDPNITAVPVTVSVIKNTIYTDATVIARVTELLTEYLSKDNWDFSAVVRRNALIAIIGGDESVAYVNALTTPAADQNLTGAAPLTTPGTINVTVTNSGGGSL